MSKDVREIERERERERLRKRDRERWIYKERIGEGEKGWYIMDDARLHWSVSVNLNLRFKAKVSKMQHIIKTGWKECLCGCSRKALLHS